MNHPSVKCGIKLKLFQGSDQYSGSYSGHGYPGYYDNSGHYYSNNTNYSKQSNYSTGQQTSDGYPGYPSDTKSNYYYTSCQTAAAPPDHANANTPLPPDFSYVGSSGVPPSHPHMQQTDPSSAPAPGYADFYAMG